MEADVNRLIPLIRITKKEEALTSPKNQQFEIKPKPVAIGINSADTTAFISLPGIGSKLAQRIINFRNKLGGFVKIEQVYFMRIIRK